MAGEKEIVYGFRGTAVFGFSQTEGASLPPEESDEAWLNDLPLLEVAKSWDIDVTATEGRNGPRTFSTVAGIRFVYFHCCILSNQKSDNDLHQTV